MNRIEFTVNGKKCSVGGEVTSDEKLLDYIRRQLGLRGTKYMCREGGCGACVVSVVRCPGSKPIAVNSCLVSVTSCHDWDITTIEKIGNRKDGYHVIQKTLAEHNGSQCGYCSPGWVMSMYSLLQNSQEMTMADIEKSFANCICRCTGYRPILEAFKTFAKDSPKQTVLPDIEDLRICEKSGRPCEKKDSCGDDEWCFVGDTKLAENTPIEISLGDNKTWHVVFSVTSVMKILRDIGSKSYMLINGNTGRGAYPFLEYADELLDISCVEELKKIELDQNLVVGGGVTLNEALDVFKQYSQNDGFEYFSTLAKHVDLVAHIPVRNIGTIAGNLMLKHEHNDFPSDIFLLLETVGATVTILDPEENKQEVTLKDFLDIDMHKKLISNVKLPPLSKGCRLVTYKIMPRAQNAIARVNAGFLYKLGKDNETVSAATLVYGGINPRFVHATRTEAYLVGKKLFTNETLQEALRILEQELLAEGLTETIVKAKHKLGLGLFYKGLLSLCPQNVLSPRYRSGAVKLSETRPVSQAKQEYETNPALYPLNQPMPKLEALIQCAGEAPYCEDVQKLPYEVFAAFVTSKIANGEIDTIDPEPALAIKGVLAFYTAKDLPGKNTFTPTSNALNLADEQVLLDGPVSYYGQPIGIIVAIREQLAERAAEMVNITYKNIKKPILTINEAKKVVDRTKLFMYLPATNRGDNTVKVIQGSTEIGGQFHFTMEKQVCVTKPSDDGIEVIPATQWIDTLQNAMSMALNIAENRLNISVRRIGGGFGSKITRASQIAVACGLVTLKLNRPCRMILPLTTNMKSIGKRLPCHSDYEVGVNSFGEIQYLEHNLYEDNGFMFNEPFAAIGLSSAKNCYDRDRWNFRVWNVLTDTAKNSWMRAPGTLETIAMIETIMERISYELSLDPIAVRLANLGTVESNEPVRQIIETLKKNADYHNRRASIKKFNQDNRWKKRGLRFTPLKWAYPILASFYVTLSVHHGDGSVVITHGGIEMGQGVNTKIVQVCAYTLNIPIDKIKVKSTNNITNINGMCSGGSFTSEGVCFGIIKCCQIILDRLAPIKILVGELVWDLLITTAFNKGVNLTANYNVTPNDQKHYYINGATLVETEVDILTGEIEILRADLLEDVGQSVNPDIDAGQLEGAFAMGLGYWRSEQLIYDQITGELLTNRAWDYFVPQARDIPQDFRVYFLKNSYNDSGVLGAKACSEPPICMTIAVAFAIREAISSSLNDSGVPTKQWFNIDGAHTIDNILHAANVKTEEFKFN